MLEASLHERNSFLTLTYEDKYLPADGNLDKRAVPKFMERLRKRRRKIGRKIRYYQCGEYGEKRKRPHYHVVLFGEDFSDSRVPFGKGEYPTWISSELCELWPFGQSLIGSVTFESASYVARYVCDKVTGSQAELHYEVVDPGTGEVTERVPEFATMSRRPGIAAEWLDRYESDVYPSDEVVVSGARSKPPRYFDKLLEARNPELASQVDERRRVVPFRKRYERSAKRLQVREVCTKARVNLFQRELDL